MWTRPVKVCDRLRSPSVTIFIVKVQLVADVLFVLLLLQSDCFRDFISSHISRCNLSNIFFF